MTIQFLNNSLLLSPMPDYFTNPLLPWKESGILNNMNSEQVLLNIELLISKPFKPNDSVGQKRF